MVTNPLRRNNSIEYSQMFFDYVNVVLMSFDLSE
jgi:hypothetical protein